MLYFRQVLLALLASCAARWALLPAQTVPAVAGKSALLIGIDTYQPAGTSIKVPDGAQAVGRFASGLIFPNLKGPAHDLDAMREVLTSAKFGFPNDDRHIHVLKDGAATHDAILAAMHRFLVDEPKAGDTVVLYISSHGSLRVNSKSDGQVYDLEGTPTPLDNTIVPADAYLGAEDILSRDLRRIFNQTADKGVHLTVIIDACHAGSQARGGANPSLVARNVKYDPRDLKMPPDKNPDGSLVMAPEDRPYNDNPVLVLSAAQKDQSAIDVQDASPPHGLFTAALVQALGALPADAPAVDIFRRVLVDMEQSGAENQQPALDTTAARKHEPLFGGDAPAGPPRTAIERVDDDGGVLLDIGPIADVGAGSEFTEMTANGGVKAVLRVTNDISISRSEAEVVSPPGAKVYPKDIVELTKWVPAERGVLKFWTGPANLSLAQIQSMLNVLRSANVALVKDPSYETWTHKLTWDGSRWTLRAHDAKGGLVGTELPPATPLGPSLTGASLSSLLQTDSIVWFDAPLPSELARKVFTDPMSAAVPVTTRSQATYVIAGRATDTGLGYAWYQRGSLDADVQTPPGFSRGCSPDSPFPLRTDWIGIDDGLPLSDEPASKLEETAQKLAKINGWQHLESVVSGAKTFPYTLGLRRVEDNQFATDGGNTFQGERYTLTLDGSVDTITTPRWVYVLGIDCQGAGELLWPREGPGGRFPTENGRLASIPLPGTTFRIAPPYGTDTYILLTSETPLPEPDVLNFQGVVRGGARGAPNPLENLLQSASSGTRGSEIPAPTDWSIQVVQMHSHSTKALDVPGKAASQP